MSLEKTFVDMAAAARGTGTVLVYAPVTVNINLGGAKPDAALGELLKSLAATVTDQAVSLRAATDPRYQAWLDGHERRQAEADQAMKKSPTSDTALKATDPELLKKGFIGQVSEEKLAKKAVKEGLDESVGCLLWRHLDTNQELRALCESAGMPFPELGRNNQFRQSDLQKLAKLDGIRGVRGFKRNSLPFRLLAAL